MRGSARLPACLIAAAMTLLVAGCGSGTATRYGRSVAVGVSTPECAVPTELPPGEITLPEGFELPTDAVVTEVVSTGAGDVVRGYVAGTPSDLIEVFSHSVEGADLEITSVDDELREAEIFFDGVVSGQVRLGRLACPPDSTGFSVIAGQ